MKPASLPISCLGEEFWEISGEQMTLLLGFLRGYDILRTGMTTVRNILDQAKALQRVSAYQFGVLLKWIAHFNLSPNHSPIGLLVFGV
jgi:hypothetical protein